ncbi:MAG: ABC transporter substrate-binding protein [Prevotella sp.]|nr:ABC transporter substrate-binding protein [Prevotella sp.]
MKNKGSKFCSITALSLVIIQIAVVLMSWLINSANGSSTAVRSLLSAEGIRWFFGHFAENLATPYLVWIILVAIAYGSVKFSGIIKPFNAILTKKRVLSFRERIAMYVVITELIGAVIVMLLLTIVPHAMLLSVSGSLFPSSFSESLIPVLAFVCILLSLSYGTMSGNLPGITAILDSMAEGIYGARYILLLYVLFVQLLFSVVFVFNL